MNSECPFDEPGRKRPVHGVRIQPGTPTIVHVVVCTRQRRRWLAQEHVHQALREIWTQGDAWLVGDYLLMPDHLHLFCGPRDLGFTLEQWVTWWKRKFSCRHLADTGEWQRDFWDTRLRNTDNYAAKWDYLRQNPVTDKLVANADDWAFQGRLNALWW